MSNIEIVREHLLEAKRIAEYPPVDKAILREVDAALAALDAEVPEDMMLVPKDLVNAVAHHGVDTGYGIFQIEDKHIQQARDLLSGND